MGNSFVINITTYRSTMNTFILFSFALCLAAVYAAPPKYSDKYDSFDIDAVLANDRVLNSYVKCLLDKGPCTKEGRDFRKYLPEALTTSCQKCTEGQKRIVRKSAKYLIKNRKSDWELLQKKFDPKSEHVQDFKKFLAAA